MKTNHSNSRLGTTMVVLLLFLIGVWFTDQERSAIADAKPVAVLDAESAASPVLAALPPWSEVQPATHGTNPVPDGFVQTAVYEDVARLAFPTPAPVGVGLRARVLLGEISGATGRHKFVRIEEVASVKGNRLVERRVMPADHVAVILHQGKTEAELRTALPKGLVVRRKMLTEGRYLIGFEAKDDEALPGVFGRLKSLTKVISAVTSDGYIGSCAASPDRLCPNDPLFAQQWGLQSGAVPNPNYGDPNLTIENQMDIDAPEAWHYFTGSAEVTVAVIDSGIDLVHEDLVDNLWTNPEESGLDGNGDDKSTNGIDDDGNGFIDDVHGWDFVNDDNVPQDDFGHGTHVAGIIGAKGNNGLGTTGVCWNASLLALKTLTNRGSGLWSDIADALAYASAKNLGTANCSFGAYGASPLFVQSAFETAENLLICAAAGNGGLNAEGLRIGDNIDEVPFLPAGLPVGHIISVGAHDTGEESRYLGAFSNHGVQSVDLLAPGVNIIASVPGNGYGTKSGTSMSCAFISGTAALMRLLKQDAPPLLLREMIQVTARRSSATGASPTTTQGFEGNTATNGRLWLWRAVLWARGKMDWRQTAASPAFGVDQLFTNRSNSALGVVTPQSLALKSPGVTEVGVGLATIEDFDGVYLGEANPIVDISGSAQLRSDGSAEDRTYPNAPRLILERITALACLSFTDAFFAINELGQLYTWGGAAPVDRGLGTAIIEDYAVPTLVPNLPAIENIFSTGTETLCIAKDGTVWGWGRNLHGCLGGGNEYPIELPTQIPGWNGSRRFYFSDQEKGIVFAVMIDGTVKVAGKNVKGMFGRDDISGSALPLPVPGLSGIYEYLHVSNHGLAIDRRGRLFEWGRKGLVGNRLATGSPAVAEIATPQRVMEAVSSGNVSLALLADGTSLTWGRANGSALGRYGSADAIYYPRLLPALEGARAISLSENQAVLVTASNRYLRIGGSQILSTVRSGEPDLTVSGITDVVQVAANGLFDAVLSSDGGVRTQLQYQGFDVPWLGADSWTILPWPAPITQILEWGNIALDQNGKLISINALEPPVDISGSFSTASNRILEVGFAGAQLLCRREDGSVRAFNARWGGLMSPLDTLDSYEITGVNNIVELANSYARDTEGRLFRLEYRQLDGVAREDLPAVYEPVSIPAASNGLPRSPVIKLVGTGLITHPYRIDPKAAAMALHADGTVSLLGDFAYGDIDPALHEGYILPGMTDAVDIWISSVVDRWMVKRADGSVWGWGNNLQGSLGDISEYTMPGQTWATTFTTGVDATVQSFIDWLSEHFSYEELDSINISGDEADPDRDGLVNLVEYALGSDPTLPSDGDGEEAGLACSFETVSSEALSADGNGGAAGELHFTVKLKRRAKRPGIEYRVEFSDDMVNWSASPTRLLKVLESEKTVIFRDVEPLSVTQRRWARLVIRKGN